MCGGGGSGLHETDGLVLVCVIAGHHDCTVVAFATYSGSGSVHHTCTGLFLVLLAKEEQVINQV